MNKPISTLPDKGPGKPTKTRKAAPASSEPKRQSPNSQSIARSVKRAAGVIGRASTSVAVPLAKSLKREENVTLAKMALAAVAPRLAASAVRVLLRNPLLATAAVALTIAVMTSMDEGDRETD